MGRVIRPRLAAGESRESELVAQNALWEEQDRLSVALAMEPDPERQQGILDRLDSTYREVAQHNWQTDWERRSYAMPDAPFAPPQIPEHVRFERHDLRIPESWQPIVREGQLVDTQADLFDAEEEDELELELH